MEQASTNTSVSIGSLFRNKVIQTLLLSTFFLQIGVWERNYSILGIICAGEPIMTKWKWAVAANVPAKVFVINENGDWFWADRSNWRIIRHFVLFRAGLSGAEAVPAIARLLVFPFTLLYLVLYAVMVHLRRAGRVRPLHQR